MYPKKLLTLLLSNLKTKTLVLFLCFFLTACSNYSFVYSGEKKNNSILADVSFEVLGADGHIAKDFLKKTIKEKSDNLKYKLKIYSTKQLKNIVMENDFTASSIEIKYILDYTLRDIKKSCDVFKKNIVTTSVYKSKAEGYQFGSEINQKRLSEQVIKENISNFLQQLNIEKDYTSCINEN